MGYPNFSVPSEFLREIYNGQSLCCSISIHIEIGSGLKLRYSSFSFLYPVRYARPMTLL